MMLVALHTVMMREHNRIAADLGAINPHWDDERVFQETRHIMAAVVQHVTYNEFLPMVLGKEVMHRYGLILNREVREHLAAWLSSSLILALILIIILSFLLRLGSSGLR